MDWRDGYTNDEVCTLLNLGKESPRDLSRKGLLPSNGETPLQLRYARDWVDELAVLLSRYPSLGSRDTPMFELYAWYRKYHAPPPNLTRGQLDRYRARIRQECEKLVVAKRACTVDELAEKLRVEPRRLYKWGWNGKLSSVRLGFTHYTSARYAAYIVELFTRWQTAVEIAYDHGFEPKTVNLWMANGELAAVRCPDGIQRASPEVIAAFFAARTADSGLTISDAAARIGCDYRILVSQVSKGGVLSTGRGQLRRIPEDEVAYWEHQFNNLNPDFAWLQQIVMPDRRRQVALLSAKQVCKVLGVQPGAVTLWSQAGLLPFFVRSLSRTVITRAFVSRYIDGLRRYAGGVKVARQQAVDYKQLCQAKGNIV